MYKSQNKGRSVFLTFFIMLLSFLICLLLHHGLDIKGSTTTIFVFAVFLVSLYTDGYIYGIIAALISTIAVNYAFTVPFYTLNFILPGNLISAILMIIIAVLTSTFVTRLKKLQALKAEGEKERMRANLLRAVSHDFRTPLTTIYGSSSAIIENKDILSQEQTLKMIQSIKEESEWLTRMVENLLSVTRIDHGKIKIIKDTVVLEELIDSVVLKVKKRYPGSIVHLDIPEEIIIIPMDAILIEQVLINLLENAIQHAEGMTNLMLRVVDTEKKVIFEVIDDGCGIDEKKIRDVFSGKYKSEDMPADSQKRNAGIGLSVCSTIIKAHDGEIWAKNISTGGASFGFILSKGESADE